MNDQQDAVGGAGGAPGGGLCSRCGGTGYIYVEENGFERAARCSCRLRPNNDRLGSLGIPPRFHDCAIEENRTERGFHTHTHETLEIAKGIASRFVQSYPDIEQGLLFMGRCGVGKTHLAVALLKELALRKAARGRFCDFHELLRQIKNSYNPVSGTSEMDLLQPVVGVDLLVLDDLGAEKPSPWVLDTLHFVINQRYLRRLTTLITTNYLDEPGPGGGETLAERIGYRLRSRLFEMCHVVRMDGQDYRREIDRSLSS